MNMKINDVAIVIASPESRWLKDKNEICELALLRITCLLIPCIGSSLSDYVYEKDHIENCRCTKHEHAVDVEHPVGPLEARKWILSW